MKHMHVCMSLEISLGDTSLDSCCYHSHPFVAVLWVPSSQDGGSQGTQDMAALVFVRAPCVRDKGRDGSKSHMAAMISVSVQFCKAWIWHISCNHFFFLKGNAA